MGDFRQDQDSYENFGAGDREVFAPSLGEMWFIHALDGYALGVDVDRYYVGYPTGQSCAMLPNSDFTSGNRKNLIWSAEGFPLIYPLSLRVTTSNDVGADDVISRIYYRVIQI